MDSNFYYENIFHNWDIKHIFQYYEEPLFFICNIFNSKYFAMLTNFEPRKWLLISVDKDNLSLLIQNKLSIKELFTVLDDKYDILSVNELNNGDFEATQINKQDIAYDDLPDDDLYIEGGFP